LNSSASLPTVRSPCGPTRGSSRNNVDRVLPALCQLRTTEPSRLNRLSVLQCVTRPIPRLFEGPQEPVGRSILRYLRRRFSQPFRSDESDLANRGRKTSPIVRSICARVLSVGAKSYDFSLVDFARCWPLPQRLAVPSFRSNPAHVDALDLSLPPASEAVKEPLGLLTARTVSGALRT
jgi:hypothetical protein